MSLAAPILLGLGLFALFLAGMAPGISLKDSGELAAASLTLGVTHPPGYPLYVLAGKLAVLLPAGCPAFRIGLLSAAATVAAALAAWRMLRERAVKPDPGLAAGLAGAAAFALSRTVWWQAGMAEKYAFAGALFACAFLSLYRALGGGQVRWRLSAALLTGLAVSHHHMGIYLTVPLLYVFWRTPARRTLALSALCFSLPVSVKLLYSPIRAAAWPQPYWSDPALLARYADYVLAGSYLRRFLKFGPAGEIAELLWRQLFVQPWLEFGPALLILPVGAWALWRFSRPLAWLALLAGGTNLVCGAVYRIPDAEQLFLPAWWLIAVAIGAGAGFLVSFSRWLAVPVAALILLQVPRSAGMTLQARDYLAPDHVRNMLVPAKRDALLIAAGDLWLLPLLYAYGARDAPADFRLAPARGLVLGLPERRRLEPIIPGCAGCLDTFQEGPALLWEITDRMKPADVYLTQGVLVGQVPSQGADWKGVLFRMKAGEAPFGLDRMSERPERWMRFRSLLRPAGLFGRVLVQYYSAAFLSQGNILLEAGRPAQAFSFARRGLRILPAAEARSGELAARLNVLAARTWLARGRTEEAIPFFFRALQLAEGRSLEALIGLADVEIAQGRPEQALGHLGKAAQLAAGNEDPSVILARESHLAGRSREAQRDYRRAISRAFSAQGWALLGRGNLYGAREEWARALELDRGNHRAMVGLGMLAFVEERFAEAGGFFKRARALGAPRADLLAEEERVRLALEWQAKLPGLRAKLETRRDAESLCDVGNACWYVGRIRAAERFYREALATEPDHARAWGNLGSVLVRRGDLRGGLEAYHRALASDPGYIEAMLNLALVHRELGEEEESREWLARAAKAQPDSPKVKRMFEELPAGRKDSVR